MTLRCAWVWLRRGIVMLWLGCMATLAGACAICAPPDGQNTVLFRLHAADRVVLAARAPAGGAWRVLEPIKGGAPAGPIAQVDEAALGAGTPPGDAAMPVVLAEGAGRWRVLGSLRAPRAAWLCQTLGWRPVAQAPVADWSARLAHFAPALEDPDALVAQLAYEEVSVAPYAALRQLRTTLRADTLRHWLDDPARQARRPLYTLLAGFAADARSEAALRERAAQAVRDAAPAALSAALAALVEARGPEGLAWVAQNYLVQPGAVEWQAQAAVLALAVHGNDGQRVERTRVVAAFEALATHNPALAGLAASDLAAWNHWDLGPRYAEILRSGQPLAFASRYAMVFYLLRSPRPEARSALEALRAANAL